MRSAVAISLALGVTLFSRDAAAIRPFVTDDARVVGRGSVQLETYWRRDRTSFQHWLLPAVGPTSWLELTVGGVHGVSGFRASSEKPSYAVAGPLLQGKFLLHEAVPNRAPGAAVVVGGLPPVGHGGFEPPGWGGFSFLALTQALLKEDDLLFHANIGVSSVAADGYAPARLTWGVGAQVETFYDVHLIGEVFSGDPYVPGSEAAYQVGFRIIFNAYLQLDGTYGAGIGEDSTLPPWFSSGIRVVSGPLF